MLRRSSAGFTYIGLLLAVALIGAGLAAIGQVWHTNVQRSREAELRFIGEQFKHAIKLYYEGTPGGDKQLPKSLEDLLRDERYPVVRRYLRKMYVDPLRGKAEWGLIKLNNGDGIVGVHSLSESEPFKNRGAEKASKTRVTYADWKFVADITLTPAQAVAAGNRI
jgi:type II secretory pathway pseudopilin PulG